jgi:DNA-binding response OmpR family regulator
MKLSKNEIKDAVCTDEGVITGRNLDMFISKLRKKLSTDPDLRITNIHGKGCRLEIVNDGEF